MPPKDFRILTGLFERNVINAVSDGHAKSPGDPVIPNLVNKYGNDVFKLHPSDGLIPLLQTYKSNVLDTFFPTQT